VENILPAPLLAVVLSSTQVAFGYLELSQWTFSVRHGYVTVPHREVLFAVTTVVIFVVLGVFLVCTISRLATTLVVLGLRSVHCEAPPLVGALLPCRRTVPAILPLWRPIHSSLATRRPIVVTRAPCGVLGGGHGEAEKKNRHSERTIQFGR
jgi:hypothetical protein